MQIWFESITINDVDTLYQWLKNPFISEWYWDGLEMDLQSYSAKVQRKIDSKYEFPYFILVDSQKIWYIQCYDCRWADKECRETIVPIQTRWVDMFIGEDLYRWKWFWWLILKEFVEQIVVWIHYAKKVMIDPDIWNIAAIKAYQKAGFIVDKEIESDGKKQLIMYLKK